MLKFNDLRALEKNETVSPFVQFGNLELTYLTGFEPGTVRSLIHYTKFPYRKIFKKF